MIKITFKAIRLLFDNRRKQNLLTKILHYTFAFHGVYHLVGDEQQLQYLLLRCG